MSTLKKTASKLKFSGMTFLHWSKATEENSFLMESASVNGIKYFKMRENVVVEVTEEDEDAGLVDATFTLPTADEIEALEKKDLVVDEAGELKAVENKPAIIPHASGKKMKAQYLNPKTGNYVSYVRWLQIKGK